jgi:hypothetical protein
MWIVSKVDRVGGGYQIHHQRQHWLGKDLSYLLVVTAQAVCECLRLYAVDFAVVDRDRVFKTLNNAIGKSICVAL